MAQIQIAIIDQVAGTKTLVEVPDDVPLNQLIPAMVTSLNLPVRQGGNPISYRLDDPEKGERLENDGTLEDAGVEEGDLLSLTPEVTAGGCIQ